MVTHINNQSTPPTRPGTPREAAECCAPVDDLLNPDLFKALADPTRARLLGCLIKCGRACSVSEVSECCSVDFSVVSRHLQLLERAGVVTAERAGRVVRYAVRFADLSRSFRALADEIARHGPDGPVPAAGCCACTPPSDPSHGPTARKEPS